MVEAGASRHEAAEHFGVSLSSVVKWMQRWNETRSAAPKPRGGSVSPLEHPRREPSQRFAEKFDRSCRASVLKNARIT
jgi:transposase